MADNQYFLRAWDVAKELVSDRNYILDDTYNKLTPTDINYLLDSNQLYLIGVKNGNEKILVRFINILKVKVSYLQSIINDTREKHPNTTIVFILKSKPSASARKLETKEKFNIQVFSLKQFQINPTKYSLVPHHIKLDSDESKKLMLKYNIICKSQLPILLQTDAISRYYNFKKDDIVKIVKRQKMSYNIKFNVTGKKLSDKEVLLEKLLIKDEKIKRKKSNIDRRRELEKYIENNNSDILRYRYVK